MSPVNLSVRPSIAICDTSTLSRRVAACGRGESCVLCASGVFVFSGLWHPGVFFRLMVSSSCRRGLCVVIVCQCVLRKKSLVVDGGLAHLPTFPPPNTPTTALSHRAARPEGTLRVWSFLKLSVVQLLQGLKRRTTLLPLALISNNKTVKVLEYKHSSATSTIAFGGG